MKVGDEQAMESPTGIVGCFLIWCDVLKDLQNQVKLLLVLQIFSLIIECQHLVVYCGLGSPASVRGFVLLIKYRRISTRGRDGCRQVLHNRSPVILHHTQHDVFEASAVLRDAFQVSQNLI